VNLLAIEMRRALQRRLVRVLILLALVMIVIAGVVEFLASQDLDLAALAAKDGHDPAVMTDWWLAGGSGDGVLAVAALFLALGGLLGGASVVGAEWRAGTLTTVLTWEPRRVRLHAARIGSSGLLATAIALVLQVVFLAAFVPSVLAHGTTAGVDAEWIGSLVAAMARIALITGLAAMLGGALATLGRNTVAAIIVAWGWLAIGEGLVRGGLPEYAKWLVGDTTTVVLTWTANEGDGSSHSPGGAVAMLLAYTAVLVVVSGYAFWRRDVAAAT
jgi:ABC-2 type transport system permease protein